MESVIDRIRTELKSNINEKTLANSQKFFKEKIQSYGVSVPTVNRISKENFKVVRGRPKTEIFDLCEILWQSGVIEESFIACRWSYCIHEQYSPKDFYIFKKWVSQYVNNWASCDTLCNHTIGQFIEMYPEYLMQLKEFAKSENRWMRRAAAVSLIVPAKKGKFISSIFELADILLLDDDELVQKGYGWMLKVGSEQNQQLVFDYVIKNKHIMPRTALRYAIEKMPSELKKQAMTK